MIAQLEQDGRQSLRALADRLDLSPSTVSNRFHRLQDDGIIKGFRPVLDYEALGFDLTAIIEVKADADAMQATVDRLATLDPVVSLYEVTGPTDIILVCKFRDREAMNGGVKQFQQVDGVTETQTKVALSAPLEGGRVDLGADDS